MRPALLKAYRETCYEAAGIQVRIGRRSPRMDRLLASHGVREATFITAYNPFSRPMPPGWNQLMQTRLHRVVRRRTVLPARGFLHRWSEAHLLVFGDTKPIRKLARQFRQNGIVIVTRGQPPHFIMTF
jgi:hypothetical protein